MISPVVTKFSVPYIKERGRHLDQGAKTQDTERAYLNKFSREIYLLLKRNGILCN